MRLEEAKQIEKDVDEILDALKIAVKKNNEVIICLCQEELELKLNQFNSEELIEYKLNN